MDPQLEALFLSIPCDYCGAAPEWWCHTLTTRKAAQFLHGPRTNPIYSAFGYGYSEGFRDQKEFHR